MPRKGLLVEVMGHDCTNHGATSGKDKAILAGDGIDELFESTEDAPLLILHRRGNYLVAIPAKEPSQPMCGPMFGGRFIYTCDSRFPNDYPIPVHDRYETQELNDLLSR